MKEKFNHLLSDSQATSVSPISPKNFDISKYEEYEKALLDKCKEFWIADQGVLVYRRMRVKEVFSAQCGDMETSLALQLGALEQSMKYKADIPNFLEPWYGIGTIASAFGMDYIWNKGQAPAVNGHFNSVDELLQYDVKEVRNTRIGKHTIDMVEYFLDKIKGRLPISYCDMQSPLNIIGSVVETSSFFMDFMLNPEKVKISFDLAADLFVNYTLVLKDLIGNCLAKPGHGFASCREFEGVGLSDDNLVMLPPELYTELAVPSFGKACEPFGGSVFHSCGNWGSKKDNIINIPGIKMADGAFSKFTDPDSNDTDGFADAFAGTGVVLNVRIVGDADLIEQKVKELWKPNMKLIVVTYCESTEEQADVYDRIHRICKE